MMWHHSANSIPSQGPLCLGGWGEHLQHFVLAPGSSRTHWGLLQEGNMCTNAAAAERGGHTVGGVLQRKQWLYLMQAGQGQLLRSLETGRTPEVAMVEDIYQHYDMLPQLQGGWK